MKVCRRPFTAPSAWAALPAAPALLKSVPIVSKNDPAPLPPAASPFGIFHQYPVIGEIGKNGTHRRCKNSVDQLRLYKHIKK